MKIKLLTQALSISVFIAGALLLISRYVTYLFFEFYVSYTLQVLVVVGAAWFATSGLILLSRANLSRAAVLVQGSTLAILGVLLVTLGSSSTTLNRVQNPDQTLTVATLNQFLRNRDTVTPATALRPLDPDLVLLQEISEPVAESLANNLDLPFTEVSGFNRSSGFSDIAILSKHPVLSVDALTDRFGSNEQAFFKINVDVDGQEVAVYSAHFPGPFSFENFSNSQSVQQALIEEVSREEVPTVVAGDLNLTPFSPVYRSFAGSLQSQGFETTTTSPFAQCSWHGFGSLACLRIDHIFYKDLGFIDQQILEDTGSDHRIVIVELAF